MVNELRGDILIIRIFHIDGVTNLAYNWREKTWR